MIRAAAACVALLLAALPAAAAEPAFPRATIDLGCVVSDLDKSLKFYVDGIGFRQVEGFDVPAELARDAGLTESKPLSIRVLVLGDGEGATKLKLMQVAGATPRTGDTEFIHSHTGFRYLTIFVADADAAVARLAALGVRPLAKGPVPLPAALGNGMTLTCVRDPDGNLVELLGPRGMARP
jgi:catechol 2,3-dioxygenase-like lactoylglutathione lyase family enzyme